MKWLIIEWMDGKRGELFIGFDTRLKTENSQLLVIGGDGSYKQRGKVQGFPLTTVRTYWTQQTKPEGCIKIEDGE